MILRVLYGYIIREFFKVFAAALIGLLVVCLVGDAADRLNDFIDAQAPGKLIFVFYLNMVPFYAIYVLPAASLVATLFTLGQMSRQNELTAMLSSGISLGRVFAPIYLLMLLVSAGSFLVDETLVPLTNENKKEIMDYQIKGRPKMVSEVRQRLDYQGENGRRWSAGVFRPAKAELEQVRLLQFSGPAEDLEFDFRVDARRARFDPDSGWVFYDGSCRQFGREGTDEWAVSFARLALPGLTERPQDFKIEVKEAQLMNFRELSAAIDRKRRNGIKITRDQVELWLKTAMPAANLIIVLFGAPLAVSRRRMGPGIGMAVGLVVYMAFMGSFYITRSLGYSGMIPPWAAAWTSNILFGAAGLIFFLKVRK